MIIYPKLPSKHVFLAPWPHIRNLEKRRKEARFGHLPWFGPNKVAADMEGNGEFDFWVIFEDF